MFAAVRRLLPDEEIFDVESQLPRDLVELWTPFGVPVLVVFSGPATYVSPHWRANKTRAGTYDYEDVQVRGTARGVNDIDFFRRLIDGLSELIEPQYAEVGDYPVWRTSMAPEGWLATISSRPCAGIRATSAGSAW